MLTNLNLPSLFSVDSGISATELTAELLFDPIEKARMEEIRKWVAENDQVPPPDAASLSSVLPAPRSASSRLFNRIFEQYASGSSLAATWKQTVVSKPFKLICDMDLSAANGRGVRGPLFLTILVMAVVPLCSAFYLLDHAVQTSLNLGFSSSVVQALDASSHNLKTLKRLDPEQQDRYREQFEAVERLQRIVRRSGTLENGCVAGHPADLLRPRPGRRGAFVVHAAGRTAGPADCHTL